MRASLGSRRVGVTTLLVFGFGLAGCGGQPTEPPTMSSTPAGSPTPTEQASLAPSPEQTATPDQGVAGTVVHFTAGDTVVEVTIHDDTATTRDFLSMLPMTLTFEDYAGMEKIAYPERGFDTTENEGMKPEVGDLFSYIPWSNLGFFYDTGSLGHSTSLVRIGTTEDLDAVMKLDGQSVTVSVVA